MRNGLRLGTYSSHCGREEHTAYGGRDTSSYQCCGALSEALSTVLALKTVIGGMKTDDKRGDALALSIGVFIPMLRSDLIALGG